jgi:hypothetical protein
MTAAPMFAFYSPATLLLQIRWRGASRYYRDDLTGKIAVLRFMAVLPVAALICAANAEIFKIEWAPELRLKDRSSINSRMGEPFDTAIAVVKGRQNARVSNCLEYLKYSGLGFAPAADRDARLLQSWGVECHALQVLRGARPARISWLKDFRLDAGAVDFLPASLAPAVSADDEQKARDAATRGLSWRQYQPGLTAKPADGGLSVAADDTTTRLDIYARGDFNRDGLEDVLIRARDVFTAGSYADTRLFLVTRDSRQSKLRVLREYK